MQKLARSLIVAMLAVLMIVPALGGRADAKVLAVVPASPFAADASAVATRPPPPPNDGRRRREGRLRWIYRHMDGGGALRPLAPVDGSTGRPASLGSGWAVRLKIPF